jgi:hypothetical protein
MAVDNPLFYLFLTVAFGLTSIYGFADDSSGERNHIEAADMTAFESQQSLRNTELDERMRLISISAPGTDAAEFIPGTTVDAFSQFHYFRMGSVLFRPSARATYSYESNFLNLSSGHYAERSYRIEPTLEAFLPLGKKGIRLDYSANYRDYRRFSLRRKWSHEINADSRIGISPLITLSIRERLVESSLDARESSPGREILFSDALFERNNAGAQMDWELGSNNTLSLTSEWNKVRFKDPPSEGIEKFYNHDEYRFGASFRRDIRPGTEFFVDGGYMGARTDDPRNITDSGGFETVAGVSTFFTPLMSGQFSIGVREEKYYERSNLKLRSLVFRGAILKEFTENARLSVAFTKDKHLSGFQQNAYYATYGLGISYSQDLGPKITFTISPGYQRNRYPEPMIPDKTASAAVIGTESRLDRLMDGSASVRIRLNQLLAFDLFLDIIRRYSNWPGSGFTNSRVGITLLVGERGITRGRMLY